MQTRSLPQAEKIPYLDGLRGYSILCVVILHLFSPLTHLPAWLLPVRLLFGNGQFGVNVFFAISGFLITSLLLREREQTGNISLRAFYQRRVARILPAAYLYVLVVGLLAALGYLQIGWGDLAAAGLFTWNYGALLHLLSEFPQAEVLKHFWSLALEEQFYLIWPGCLLLLGRERALRVTLSCLALLPAIRFASYFATPGLRGQLNAMFHTGIDQIFWGVAVALILGSEQQRKLTAKPWFGPMVAGYALFVVFGVGAAGLVIPSVNRFIAPTAYASCASLTILWLLTGSGGLLRAALEYRWVRWMGTLSYSLYIWQQIFLVPHSPFRARFPLNVGIALLAAILSYYVVEAPLRRRIRAAFSQRPREDYAQDSMRTDL
jgi:peptidoglycan/LPS O-acetylase OafA/YrhL